MIAPSKILEVKDLCVGYGKTMVLQDVSFSLAKGEILAITGQNGTGKSTLLKSIAGLLPPKGGQIIYNGMNLIGTPPFRFVKLGISIFLQGGLIMPSLTVEEHLLLGSGKGRNIGIDKKFENVFDHFPQLIGLRKTLAGNLSGGERQILSLGILIAQNTHLWLLDEITAGLAPEQAEFTVDFIKNKNTNKNISIILIEHNYHIVNKISHKILQINDNYLLSQKQTHNEANI